MSEGLKKGIGSVFETIPQTLKVLHEEANEVGKTIVQSHLQSHEIVTRTEFEEQKVKLQEIIEKLATLEVRISQNIK